MSEESSLISPRAKANAIGADDVVGITTHVHELGGLIEFMAIGTAVKRRGGATPAPASLPVQAIIRDKDTWISGDDLFAAAMKSGGGGEGISAPLRLDPVPD